jgi:hypothetical protein
MDPEHIDTDTDEAQATITEFLEANTGSVLVVEELVDRFTGYAYFIPLENGDTVRRRWGFKHDEHVDHPDPTPVGTWSSSRLPHATIAKGLLLTGIDRLTVAEIGEIEIVNENQNNTKFLVDIGAEHIEAHVDNYYEDYAVEEIPAE